MSAALYGSASALKTTLSLTGTTFDADITAALTAASRVIDEICGRRFYADADATAVRYYSPDDQCLLLVDDIVTVASLKTADDGSTTFANTWTVNVDYVLEPLNAPSAPDPEPYTHIRAHPNGSYRFNTYYPRSVEITAQFGWSAVPGAITQATTILATRLFKTAREAPMGVLAYEGVAVRLARADSSVMGLLAPYILHRVAVA